MADSPGSTLSSIASDEFPEDIKLEDAPPSHSPRNLTPRMRATKRRRTGAATYDRDHHTPISSAHEADHDDAPPSPASTISTDTSGEVPNSPQVGYVIPDEDAGQGLEQVTVCRWDGCNAGDLGNMDVLVEHIKDVHIGTRQKKYACEWEDCTRKGTNHASGYALRAHMRSHTREKPFYCALPECDRSFTRSDALAKHMRTVHETEALRPSDPVPKHHPQSLVAPAQAAQATANAKQPRLRLVFSSKSSTTDHDQDHDSPNGAMPAAGDGASDADDEDQFAADLEFSPSELSLGVVKLVRLLRRQLRWTSEVGEELREDIKGLESEKRIVVRENELVMGDLVKAMVKNGLGNAMDAKKWLDELNVGDGAGPADHPMT